MTFERKFEMAYQEMRNSVDSDETQDVKVRGFISALNCDGFFAGLITGNCEEGLRVYRDGTKTSILKTDQAPNIDSKESFKQWLVAALRVIENELDVCLIVEPRKSDIRTKRV